MPQLTEGMVRKKVGRDVVDVWRQVVRDHLQHRWRQVMEDVIVGSELLGSTSALQERTVKSGAGIASTYMNMEVDNDDDDDEEDQDSGEEEEQNDDDDHNEGGSGQYRAITATLSQILRPGMQEDFHHIVDALDSRQDTMTDLMSNAAVMGQKIVLLVSYFLSLKALLFIRNTPNITEQYY